MRETIDSFKNYYICPDDSIYSLIVSSDNHENYYFRSFI